MPVFSREHSSLLGTDCISTGFTAGGGADTKPSVSPVRACSKREREREEYKQSPIGRTNKRIEFGKEERVNDEKREQTRTRGKEIRLLVLIGLLRSRHGRGGRVWLGKVVHDSFE